MDEQFELYKSRNTIIITKKNVTLCAIDRKTLEKVDANPTDNQKRIPFLFLLGLFKYKVQNNDYIYYLVLVTKTHKIGFFNTNQIESFEIIPLTKHQKTVSSQKFVDLLRLGLIHCSMYYSDDYDLTLTLQNQFSKLPSRSFFVWNYEAIYTLNKIWPYATCYKKVIAGCVKNVFPFVIISRKSNKNGGCHTWNRGADINGNVANFVENEEIMFLDNRIFQSEKEMTVTDSKINAISHIEIGGSCPFFWSQYPNMYLSRPYHFGPDKECERRFNLHFDHLCESYYIGIKDDDPSLVIISLLNDKGKEFKLNSIYRDLANKRGIEFMNINFNHFMQIKDGLSNEIDKFKDKFDACVVKNGVIVNKQTKIPRVNCSSCLDRTSVFMELLFESIFKKYEPEIFNKNVQTHKNLWLIRANTISKEYAITKGQKTYMIETGYKTTTGKYYDFTISIQRFFNSIFYEGKYCDAYNAVLQERPFTNFDHNDFFRRFLAFIQLLLIFIFLYIFKGSKTAQNAWKARIKSIINHPHIPDLRDADEFEEIDFLDLKEKSETPDVNQFTFNLSTDDPNLFMNEYTA